MDASGPSCHLFTVDDGPRPDLQIDEPIASAAPTRNAFWVLRWAASLTAIFVASVRLIAFGCELAAENDLMKAARAGAWEATLPQATAHSVEQTVLRRLRSYSPGSRDLAVFVAQNCTPVIGLLNPQEGDRFSVTVTLHSSAALPWWLQMFSGWALDHPLEGRAERRMPGRLLRTGTAL